MSAGQFPRFFGVAGDLLSGEVGQWHRQGVAQRVDGGGEFEQKARVFADGEQAGDGFSCAAGAALAGAWLRFFRLVCAGCHTRR